MMLTLLVWMAAMQEVPARTITRSGDSLLAGSDKSLMDKPTGAKFKVHDHIQIVVVERARARAAADFNNDKRSRTEIKVDDWPKLAARSEGFPPRLEGARLTGDPEINVDARYRQDNKARTSRDFDLTFSVMAEVVSVLPNGNVMLEARKIRRVNEEEEIIRITGEASPAFIVANQVRSENIMNLRVEYNGTGAVTDSADQGLLGWVVSKIWPF